MKAFMEEDFLLGNEPAKVLFHQYAKSMPILDYHCHINPKEIAEDMTFENITKVWLGGDHYKWRVMRANGVPEEEITGNAPDRVKFQRWAETLERCVGNPLYHWSHLELQRYFGYQGALNGDTAEEVWKLCNEKLKDKSMSVRGLILQSKVEVICTTDDPADDLRWHKMLREDTTFPVKVLPAMRPDKAMNLEKEDYLSYLDRLGKAAGITITSFQQLKEAMKQRMDYFAAQGCVLSDHALESVMYAPGGEEEIEDIFARRLVGKLPKKEEEQKCKMAFLYFLAGEYRKRNWVMQLHYGCKRDNNKKMWEKLGPDTGYDCIHTETSAGALADFCNGIEEKGGLPKLILYSLNPADNPGIVSVMGCFQGEVPGKMQHGSAWWFNDNKTGMIQQLTDLANGGVLGNFVGMLTDSRSFLSYTRHEYFRRILCNLVGTWIEAGEYPWEEERVGKLIQDISYGNAKEYFGF